MVVDRLDATVQPLHRFFPRGGALPRRFVKGIPWNIGTRGRLREAEKENPCPKRAAFSIFLMLGGRDPATAQRFASGREGVHRCVEIVLGVERRNLRPDSRLAIGDHRIGKPDDINP